MSCESGKPCMNEKLEPAKQAAIPDWSGGITLHPGVVLGAEQRAKFMEASRKAAESISTVFRKHDIGKRKWSLVPWDALGQVVDVLMFGARKYSENNWALCPDPDRYSNAAMRHLIAYMQGEKVDGESGLPHLAHAGCSILFQLALDIRGGKK